MAVRKRSNNSVPLIVEEHPEDYEGYPFITLIQYRKQFILAIVDNSNENTIKGYVLDLCGPEQVDEDLVLNVATEWYQHRRLLFPVSVEFSRLGLSGTFSRIYRTYNTEFITRVIGPLPKFGMSEVQRIKRKKKRPVPPGVEVEIHKIDQS